MKKKRRKLKKNVKIITLFLVVLATIITPFVFSKYTTTFKDKIIVNIRQPHYQVVFHSNNGSNPEVTTTQDFVYGTAENLDANTFTKTNYHFSKWTTERDGTGTSYEDEEEVNKLTSAEGAIIDLYAQWKEELVVTFDSNGGIIPEGSTWDGSGNTASKHIKTSTYGTMPKPTKNGYTFLGWSEYNLPSEYQEVEYIEFTGSQYIDTGIIPSNHTTEIKFDFEEYANDEHLLGTNSGYQKYHFTAYSNKYYWGNNKDGHGGTWTSGVHILLYNGNDNIVQLDEKILDEGNAIMSSTNLWIGRRENTTNFDGKVYYVKITDKSTGELVRNFIPCYRKDNGVIGLYDLVEGNFYTNQGTGTFNKGEDLLYITKDTVVTKTIDHTLYAIWEYNPKVTFDANGGEVNTNSKTVKVNEKYGNLPTPTRVGYTFLGWSNNEINNNLPSEYQEVEYIESTGTQYIETNVVATSSTGIYAKLSSTDISNDTMYIGSNSPYYYLGNNSSKIYYAWNSVLSTNSRPEAVLNEVNEFELNYMNSKKFTYKDTTFNISGNLTSGTRKLMIFAGNYGSASYKSKIKLYRLKISELNNIKNDFIPCYRKSDNVIGLYDLVGGEFYTDVSNSSTPFEKGKDISYITDDTIVTETLDHTLYAMWGHNPTVTFDSNGGSVSPSTKVYNYNSTYGNLPTPIRSGYAFMGWKAQAYQEVEYIEATSNQYILTNIIPSINYRVVADIYKSNSNTSEACFMGARDSSTNKGIEYYFTGSSLRFWINNGSNSSSLDAGNFYNQIVHYEASNKSTGMELVINGSVTRTNTFSYGTGQNVTPLTIFAYNDKGTPRYFYNGRIYSLKIYNENTLINDLKPCYRTNDGKIGMYDVVKGVFYTNQGAGTFSKGNDLNSLIFDTDVTSSTQMVTNKDHTLYAIWEEE